MTTESTIDTGESTQTDTATDTTQTAEEPKFTQTDVNKIAAESRQQARRAALKDALGDDYEADIDRFKEWKSEQAKSADTVKSKGKSGDDDRFAQLEKRIDDLNQANARALKEKDDQLHAALIDTALVNEASKAGATNPEQVRDLMSKRVKLDDGKPVVVNEHGETEWSASNPAQPKSVGEAVQDFLNANPHFQKAGAKGAGTTTTSGDNKSISAGQTRKLSELDPNNPEDLKYWRDQGRKEAGMGEAPYAALIPKQA